ncbi:hypothetical protein ACIGKR_11375 [Rhodococcus qingshengii]|uniref:hypothetical protein n=1 Tax=Rhodococcus TaxID=1827 RepID=UPI0004C4110B|nr:MULTISPECIES: hypothetical protein [Rhodococcus]MCJ0897395.1 hypothetical protein [Rhodococcus sp. ARC_M13]OFE05306.1 hypothetical protein A5N83_28115 [Rhodococcus sp. 1139]QOS61913.1 hypothetical protein IM699_21480 [Rhodococcus qingshengii]BBE47604.1 hypothetical protein RE2895_45350 [Rhodococcus erythropolis]
MRIRHAVVGVAITGLVLAVAGCGSGDGEAAEGPGIAVAAETKQVPDRVTVHRPGLIDTSISPFDVPAWPGPHPSEFLEPNPPSGESGEIAGDQAAATYAASLDNPDALWNVGGTVEWLVVEPIP